MSNIYFTAYIDSRGRWLRTFICANILPSKLRSSVYIARCNTSRKLIFQYINKIQQDATVCRYLFTAKLLYMFRVSSHPSSGVHQTVTAASGTGHITYQGNNLPSA